MSRNYRVAQPKTVKTTTTHDSINIYFKRDGTIQTKMTVKHTAVEQKYDGVVKSNNIILDGNKPFACDVTFIRITEYQYMCPPNGRVRKSKTQMRLIVFFFCFFFGFLTVEQFFVICVSLNVRPKLENMSLILSNLHTT